MAITPPSRPAVANYPDETAYAREIEAAKAFFDAEITSTSGWKAGGEKDGVKLEKKIDSKDPAAPLARGSCLVENATTDQMLSVVALDGMRKLWDKGSDKGFILKRFSRWHYQVYSSTKGVGWIVSSRDIVGVQRNYVGSERNSEITVITTSVQDPECPPVSGKVRATLTCAGWRLTPVDRDVQITYLVKLNLEGSLPDKVVAGIAADIPLNTGRVRDAYYSNGCPPRAFAANGGTPVTQFENETLSLSPPVWKFTCTLRGADRLQIVYDTERMFLNGVKVRCDNANVSIKDDTVGNLDVEIGDGGQGDYVELIVSEK